MASLLLQCYNITLNKPKGIDPRVLVDVMLFGMSDGVLQETQRSPLR